MRAPAELSAPGKAFVAGEYSVLERGEPALVLAVDLRLRVVLRELRGSAVELTHAPSAASLRGELGPDGLTWTSGIPAELRFAARAAGLAAKVCAEEGRERRGFAAAFHDDLSRDGRKLGLGGSAAASVLAIRATCAAQGRDLEVREVISLAAAAHWVEQGGRGSGADVAACASGGLIEVRSGHPWSGVDEVVSLRGGDLLRASPLDVTQLRVPSGLRFLLVWTGHPADSRALVGSVLTFARARPARWSHHVRALSTAEAMVRDALERTDEAASLDAIRRSATALAALGDDAQVAIVTEAIARACAIASGAGAAGKPSGAGGGDCAIVLAWGDAAERARAALERAGYFALEVAPAAP